VSLSEIHPSPENDKLYRPVDLTDPEIVSLAESIRIDGVKEPLVITLDGYILSGHRRYAAAKLAGLTAVPMRIEAIRRSDDLDEFVRLLREYNRQRVKTRDERFREELVTVNPTESYQSLIEHRRQSAVVKVESLPIIGTKRRARISSAKDEFLSAIQRVLTELRKFWPLSDRQIHYQLLNDPPLKHASKPKSRYCNDDKSYDSLTELVTRARLTGDIPFEAVGDETRPVTIWSVFPETGTFVRKELGAFLKGYWRNLMQSQPNHVEIVGEKNTSAPLISPVASEYCIPLTIGRGFCSLPPRHAMSQRFQRSGKQKLVVLIVSDFDPDGETIAHSFARSMRDDFGIENIHPIKVALTKEQVDQFHLPCGGKAKKKSATYQSFHDKYGDDELEALKPAALQQILRDAIDAVIDRDAFNAELDSEKQDAAHLEAVRRTVHRCLLEAGIDGEGVDG
jgi:ParB-like chromosome segregation protein Spo0J